MIYRKLRFEQHLRESESQIVARALFGPYLPNHAADGCELHERRELVRIFHATDVATRLRKPNWLSSPVIIQSVAPRERRSVCGCASG